MHFVDSILGYRACSQARVAELETLYLDQALKSKGLGRISEVVSLLRGQERRDNAEPENSVQVPDRKARWPY